MGRYHAALIQEVKAFAQHSGRLAIKTVFLGGGTPSTYPLKLLLDMFDTLRGVFTFEHVQEVTIEINPGAVQPGAFASWRSAGINRISIGVQSVDEQVLRGLNRHQSAADCYELLAACARHFDNVSVDLMLGLPGVSVSDWQRFLEQVVTWPIQHISMYCLTVHENTVLYYQVLRGEIVVPDDEVVADMYQWTVSFLREHGFMQYEVSNFARAGYESKHNMCYWQRGTYRGFGLSACSFDGTIRTQNESNLLKYLEKMESGQEVVVFHERLTGDQVRLERLLLGLRCVAGVPMHVLFDGISGSAQCALKEKIARFVQQGLACEHDGRLCLTVAGFALENEIITQLSV